MAGTTLPLNGRKSAAIGTNDAAGRFSDQECHDTAWMRDLLSLREASMTLQQLFDDFYRPLRLRGRSPQTWRLYENTIRNFGRFLGRPATLSDLEDLALSRYVENRTSKVSPFTAEKERSQLMALARLAWERRLIDVLPNCPPGVLPQRVPKAWTVDEIKRLHQAAAETKGQVGGISAGVWWPALVHLCWESGERIGAIMQAKWENLSRPHLLLPAESRKGGRRDRIHVLTDRTCDRLEMAHKTGREELLWWPGDRLYIYKSLHRILKRAGLDGKRVAFHQLRRTGASHLAAAGGDATAFLDHASPRTTQRWYLDPRMTQRGPRPCDLLPRIDEA